VEKIVEAGKAFKNVDTEACILTVKKESVDGYKIQIYQRDNEKFSFVQSIYPKVFKTLTNKIFNVRLTQQSFRVLRKNFACRKFSQRGGKDKARHGDRQKHNP
jgi:hypothetical protein